MSSYTTGRSAVLAARELKYCSSLSVFIKTIISFALVGHEIVRTNSYLTRAHGMIFNHYKMLIVLTGFYAVIPCKV